MKIHLPTDSKLKHIIIKRFVGKMIDIFIVFFLAVLLPYPFGPLLAFFYSILADGIDYRHPKISFQGQSIGKKIMNLQVQNLNTKRSIHWKDSALRNAPIGIATFFAIIPLWGWILAALVGIPLVLMEVYLMLTVEGSHRLGDIMADTDVVELE